MKFKSKKNTCKLNTIIIKRSITVDDELKSFIFMNSNYRRKVWNDFVTEYYRCKDCGEKFNAMDFKKRYYNEIEKPANVYSQYTTGISLQVMKDVINGIQKCLINNGHLHYRKFDRFKCSFKVHTVAHYRDIKDGLPRLESKVHVIEPRVISYSDRINQIRYIKLNEPLFIDAYPIGDKMMYFNNFIWKAKYAFSEEDIKEISFCHELGKFYICLSVNIHNIYDMKNEKTKREKYAGIDLGIHNPITITDKNGSFVLRMSQRELNRIHYLERRVRRLQHIMDRKFYENKKRGNSPYSNNFIKVQRKYRVAWYKIRNIRLQWRRKVSKYIATKYKAICVDNFKTPTYKDHEIQSRKALRKIHAYNRIHAMYDCSRLIEHMCTMYKTKYIPSPENTTRTCSYCNHINGHLLLSQRVLKCENCNRVIDRDVNASQNCYNFIRNL